MCVCMLLYQSVIDIIQMYTLSCRTGYAFGVFKFLLFGVSTLLLVPTDQMVHTYLHHQSLSYQVVGGTSINSSSSSSTSTYQFRKVLSTDMYVVPCWYSMSRYLWGNVKLLPTELYYY